MTMIDRIKAPLIFIVTVAFFAWVGTGIYAYFTHITPPVITLNGIADTGSYARNAQGSISANNSYKISHIIVTLDDKEILNQRVKAKEFDAPFSIDTTVLTDGAHTLEVQAIDSSYHANKTSNKITINIDNTPLHAAFVNHEYHVDQGKTIHMKIQSNKKLQSAQVKCFNKTFSFNPDGEESTCYECFIPVDCETAAQEFVTTTDIKDLVGNSLKLDCKVRIKDYAFKKQRGFSIAEDKLNQEKEISMSMKVLNEALDQWVAQSPNKKMWTGPFDYPIEVQRMTTPFGEIRMTPERGRHMHKGIDLINRPKCVVWAAQHGKVIIKDRFFLTGNTIVIDHGVGIFTLYAHLDEYADINVGDFIKKGCPVGKLGMTGYATGYHLHWELRVHNVPVDPIEWTSTVF